MEIAALMDILKHLPDGISLFLLIVILGFTFLHKRKELDTNQMISVSKLQTNQLKELIEQNTKLSKQLEDVRDKLVESQTEVSKLREEVFQLRNQLAAAQATVHLLQSSLESKHFKD